MVRTPRYEVSGIGLPAHHLRTHGGVGVSFGTGTVPAVSPLRVTASDGAASVCVNGFVAYSDVDASTQEAAHAKGMYKIALDGTFTNLNATDFSQDLDASYGGVLVDDTYYAVYVWDSGDSEIGMVPFIQKWNASTWTLIDADIAKEAGVVAYDLTYDATSGKIFGLFADQSTPVLGVLDVENGKRTTVGPLDRAFVSIAADDNGVLYGIDYAAGQLWTINPVTAQTTFVGATGVVSAYTASACYDTNTGKILWAPTTAADDAALYAIDPATGAASKLMDFEYNDQVLGIFASESGSVSDRPGAVENLQVTFAGGSLEGTVSFTAPAANANGSVSDGLTYSVTVDDAEPLTGTVAYGAEASVPVTVATEGKHDFAVSVSNGSGTSPVKRASCFAGFGIPSSPSVTLEREGDINHVSWTAVSTTTDGGFIDAAAVTYTVTRYPSNTVVAENIADTSFDDEVAADSPYSYFYYEVTATNGTHVSEAGVSNRFDGGFITPPYLQTFDDASSLDGYTVINVNNDNVVWTIDSNAAYLKYNSSLASDDWLITPPLVLEAGKLYGISMDVKGRSGSYDEKFAVMLGTDPTVAGMTQTVIPETEFRNASYTTYLEYVEVPATGTYYLGIHGCSDKNKYALYVDNLSVSAPMSAQAPGAISDVKVVPSPDGSASATISFSAPAVDLAGNELTEITSLTVSRGGTAVKTFDSPAPGATLSFSDSADEEGDYSYTAVAANSHGEGRPSVFTAYLGVNVPGHPVNIAVAEPATGKVTISWDAPSTDADGYPINADLISYNVYRPNDNGYMVALQKGVSETSYTYQARPASVEQAFETYGVQAVTRRGSSNIFKSATVPVGSPYTLPYKESFHHGAEHHIHAVQMITGGEWSATDDHSLAGLTSVDGDDGFMAMFSNIATESSMLHTGKIDLGEAVKPTLTFYTYNLVVRDPDTGEVAGSIDQNILTVSVNDRTEGFVDKLTVAMDELPAEGWNRLTVDLTPYRGKVIELGFTAYVVNKQYTLIDDVRVFDLLGHNISATSVTVPEKVKPDEPFTVSVGVENNGENTTTPYTVELYRNDVKVQETDGPELASGTSGKVSFTETLNVAAGEQHQYHAALVYDADMDPSDNVAGKKTVKLQISNVPAPANLTATAAGNVVTLSWDEPDATMAVADPVTDDFESYDSFATENVGEWTFVDGDNLPIGNFDSIGMPGITRGSLLSFFVNDATHAGWQSSINGNSGNKFLAQVYVEGGPCDDWLISPRLFGGAQTVTFYARSYNSRYLESMEMLYSTATMSTSDFTRVKEVRAVSANWTKYTFDIPEGAEYFAIRCTSNDCAMLFIDDINYCPYVETSLELAGYHVYRDGERLTEAPCGENTYTDVINTRDAATQRHAYVVSAVYSVAESRPSNEAVVDVSSGLSEVTSQLNVTTLPGEVLVKGACGMHVSVFGVDGVMLFDGQGTEELHVAVAPGTYVVTAGGNVFKVQVK